MRRRGLIHAGAAAMIWSSSAGAQQGLYRASDVSLREQTTGKVLILSDAASATVAMSKAKTFCWMSARRMATMVAFRSLPLNSSALNRR
jgi:hypothetical protein